MQLANGNLEPFLVCPSCKSPIQSESPTELRCLNCSNTYVFDSQNGWDFRLERAEILGFSRQWVLFEQGAFGNSDLIYGLSDQHRIHQVLHDLNLSEKDIQSLKIVEIGFGHGRLLRTLQTLSPCTIGVDLAKPIASAKLDLSRVLQCDLHRLPFAQASFDLLISMGVLHHTENTREALKAILPCVKPSGLIYVYLYEKNCPRSLILRKLFSNSWKFSEHIRLSFSLVIGFFWAFVQMWSSNKNITFKQLWSNCRLGIFDIMSPRWSHQHSPDEILSWFEESNFKVKRLRPCVYLATRIFK